MTDIPIDTIDVVAKSYSDERYSELVRMAEVREMFKYPPQPKDTQKVSFAAPSSKSAPDAQNIMDVINQGVTAPASTSLVIVPENISQNDLQNLQDVSLLDTYVSVNSAAYIYNLHPQGFDITIPQQAAAFNKVLAKARFRVLTQGLAGLLSLSSSAQQDYVKNTTAGELHLEFIGEIFKSFAFPAAAITQIDSILTSVVKQLSNLKFSWSEQGAGLTYLLSTYYFEEVQGLPGARVPKIRLFYLSVDQRSWELSIGKSSLNKFEFKMNYVDYQYTMSLTQMPAMREGIKTYITATTQQQLTSIQNLVAMSAITP